MTFDGILFARPCLKHKYFGLHNTLYYGMHTLQYYAQLKNLERNLEDEFLSLNKHHMVFVFVRLFV